MLAWAGGTAIGLAVLFLLVVFVLPSPVARYAIEDQLEQLGIDHQGVETVEIDIWNSEVAAGPIKIRSQDAKHGEIAEAGFRYSFNQLFEKRAFVELFFVRGVDLEVKRHEDGSITFNGIPLERLQAADDQDGTETAAEAEDDGSGFGAGVSRFEFTDSRLVFADYTGGTLTLNLERLLLADFFMWDPQAPGTFELDGTLNDIAVQWRGTARPFAEPKTVTLDARIRDATIDKLALFTGPTGLARQDGTIETDVRYEYALHAGGLIEGSMDGTYRVGQLHIATEAGDELTLESGSVDIDFIQKIGSDDSMSLAGAVAVKTSPMSLVGAAGRTAEVGEIAFAIDELHIKKLAETREIGTILVAAKEEIARSDKTPTVIGLLVSTVRDIVINALEHQVELDGKPSIEVQGATIELPAEQDGTGVKVSFDSLAANLGVVDTRTLNRGLSTTGSLELVLGPLQADLPELGLSTAGTRIAAQSIEMKRVDDDTSVSFDLSTVLRETKLVPAAGGEVGLGQVEFGTTGISVAGKAGAGHLEGPLSLSVEGIAGSLPSEGGALALNGNAVRMNLPAFRLDGDDTLAAALSGMIEAEALQVSTEGETPLSLQLASSQVDLQSIRIAPVAADASIEGALAGKLADLKVALDGTGGELTLAASQIDASAEALSAQISDPPTMKLSGGISVGPLEGTLPFAKGDIITTKVAETNVSLSSLLVEGGTVKAAAEIETGEIAVRISEQSPQAIDIDALRIAGVNADPNDAIAIESIVVDGLDVALNEGLLALGGGGGEAGAAAEADGDAATPTRIGQFSISPGARILFTDGSVDPAMKLEIVVERATVGPIDTGAPETKTDIDLDLAIDGDAHAEITGWASPLRPTPDFDLTTDLDRMPLPPFSPYAGAMVGMNIDSGALSADAQAAATGGALAGDLKILVDDLYLEPLSDEDGKSFESDFGVPVNFAVGILKNDKGQIDLGFPLSGTVEEPELDYSEAISKAIAGAAAAILPTSWFGDDGRSFEIEPVIFVPGTTEITEEGATSADKIGALLTSKPQLTIRLCGRAAAADLIVFRGGELPDPDAEEPDAQDPAGQDPDGQDSDGQDPDDQNSGGQNSDGQATAEPQPLAKPTSQEVDQLLALAEQRRKAVQKYLIDSHGIDKAKIFDCRSTYSTEGSRPPRAEFRL